LKWHAVTSSAKVYFLTLRLNNHDFAETLKRLPIANAVANALRLFAKVPGGDVIT